jgi:hypothetical protein
MYKLLLITYTGDKPNQSIIETLRECVDLENFNGTSPGGSFGSIGTFFLFYSKYSKEEVLEKIKELEFQESEFFPTLAFDLDLDYNSFYFSKMPLTEIIEEFLSQFKTKNESLDDLLDIIHRFGIDHLSPQQKKLLEKLSQ